ncbi:MAG: type II toxin-antitoxin system MqsA family antitoxin [Magnetococcales bacterium]|nr:type II toxin-antitoxin system MqsA family antitoxin [Magnetococcales bacterium]
MSDNQFESIKKGLEEALAYGKGEIVSVKVTSVNVPEDVDVKKIRGNTGLTQQVFAQNFGFALSAVRDWEQGRRRPDRSARVLLKVIEREPEAVERALAN